MGSGPFLWSLIACRRIILPSGLRPIPCCGPCASLAGTRRNVVSFLRRTIQSCLTERGCAALGLLGGHTRMYGYLASGSGAPAAPSRQTSSALNAGRPRSSGISYYGLRCLAYQGGLPCGCIPWGSRNWLGVQSHWSGKWGCFFLAPILKRMGQNCGMEERFRMRTRHRRRKIISNCQQ